jgi:hypothetical protein
VHNYEKGKITHPLKAFKYYTDIVKIEINELNENINYSSMKI